MVLVMRGRNLYAYSGSGVRARIRSRIEQRR